MTHDPIVDEVRKVREELAALSGFDVRRIIEEARKRQANSNSRIVSYEMPKQPDLAPVATGD